MLYCLSFNSKLEIWLAQDFYRTLNLASESSLISQLPPPQIQNLYRAGESRGSARLDSLIKCVFL